MNLEKLKHWYDHVFSVEEVYASKVLKAALGALLFAYFLTFNVWISEYRFTIEAVKEGVHLCWPYAQNCGDWYFLSGLPFGYTANIFYMFLFALMGWSAWSMLVGKWRTAHALMWPLFIWKTVMVLWLSMTQVGNYEYYHLVFSAILLALPHKLFFLKFSVVWFYFLSVAAKIHPSWTLGLYFSSLKTGLPILPDALMPVWTNAVIFMEMVAAWWLLGPKSKWQRIVFIFFVFFHLYSGLLVNYRYPATVLPMLFILFGPWYTQTAIPKGWKTAFGWILMGLLAVGQSISHLIPGDEKSTLEGNFYGLYMFEANHQCREEAVIYRTDQDPETRVKGSFQARNRCDAYRVWFKYQQLCKLDPSVERIAVKFDHSINGNPFYRTVDLPNICAVDYKPFSRNAWIKTDKDGAELQGYPMRNYYY